MWDIVEQGIYFLAYDSSIGATRVEYFDFATKRTAALHILPWPRRSIWMGGIAVSNDGKSVYFPHIDHESSNLMMIENWQ
jgi:hypothetical protein